MPLQAGALKLILPPKSAPLFAEPHKRFTSIRGGRGSAKSHTVATFLLLEGMKRQHRILCAREFQNSISESVLKLLQTKIAELGLSDFYEVQRNTIIGKNGTEFIFAGLRHNIQSIKSMEGITIVWLEEAQGISEESYQILLPTIRAEGSYIILTWNPNSENDPTWERFVTHLSSDCIDIELNWRDNPHWNATLEAERLRDKERLSDEDYEWIWEGKCRKLANSRIFPNKFIVEAFETPVTAHLRFGSDFGFAADPSTLVRCFEKDKNLFIDYEAYEHGVELDDLPAFYDQIPGSRRWIIYGDSSRPDTISHLQRKAFRIEPCIKGPGSVDDGIAFLKSYKQIVIHPRCKHTHEEFKNYSWKVDRITGEVLPVPVDNWNHIIDAVRYSLSPLIRNSGTSPEIWKLLNR